MLRINADVLPGVPWVESPFFSDHFDFERTDPTVYQAAVQLNRQGYAIIDFPDPDIDLIADRVIDALHDRYDWEHWRANGEGMRIQDAWSFNPDVRSIAANPQLLTLLSALYGRRAFPFQTLNFPVGTQQHYHTDSVHFSSMPERFMCGVWTALEDVHLSSGPLIYYPGSHKWPIYVNEHIGHTYNADLDVNQGVYHTLWNRLVSSHDVQPERAMLRKGQALIWAANLLHGGDQHRDRSRTRWSQVTHYYFEGCSYYTPMRSDPALGSIYFRTPLDISSGLERENVYNGETVPADFIEQVDPKRRTRLPPDFDAQQYLLANPDVAAAGEMAERHYVIHGVHEGRPLRPPQL